MKFDSFIPTIGKKEIVNSDFEKEGDIATSHENGLSSPIEKAVNDVREMLEAVTFYATRVGEAQSRIRGIITELKSGSVKDIDAKVEEARVFIKQVADQAGEMY